MIVDTDRRQPHQTGKMSKEDPVDLTALNSRGRTVRNAAALANSRISSLAREDGSDDEDLEKPPVYTMISQYLGLKKCDLERYHRRKMVGITGSPRKKARANNREEKKTATVRSKVDEKQAMVMPKLNGLPEELLMVAIFPLLSTKGSCNRFGVADSDFAALRASCRFFRDLVLKYIGQNGVICYQKLPPIIKYKNPMSADGEGVVEAFFYQVVAFRFLFFGMGDSVYEVIIRFTNRRGVEMVGAEGVSGNQDAGTGVADVFAMVIGKARSDVFSSGLLRAPSATVDVAMEEALDESRFDVTKLFRFDSERGGVWYREANGVRRRKKASVYLCSYRSGPGRFKFLPMEINGNKDPVEALYLEISLVMIWKSLEMIQEFGNVGEKKVYPNPRYVMSMMPQPLQRHFPLALSNLNWEHVKRTLESPHPDRDWEYQNPRAVDPALWEKLALAGSPAVEYALADVPWYSVEK